MTNDELDIFIKKFQPGYIDAGTGFRTMLDAALTSESVLLDIGCGRQTYADDLYKKAKRRVGIDVDAYAKENPLMDEVVICNAEKLPFPDASFDVITAQWVMEHVGDAAGFVQEVMRVLKPGGSFVFMTPNTRSPFVIATRSFPTVLKQKLRTWILGFADDETFPTYYRLNNVEMIEALFKIAGASNIHISHHDCYGYFRFSKIVTLLVFTFYQLVNLISKHREHHIVGSVRK
jgi:2-polyprenyl-3-methyl-5-hydroxy-6-metoxy-1,4-benzoquinol methylase